MLNKRLIEEYHRQTYIADRLTYITGLPKKEVTEKFNRWVSSNTFDYETAYKKILYGDLSFLKEED